jgi:hypothetical protein
MQGLFLMKGGTGNIALHTSKYQVPHVTPAYNETNEHNYYNITLSGLCTYCELL